MPPKPTGKKGDVEDFSDAATLPQANIFKFSLAHKAYLSSDSREKVNKAIKDKLVPTSLDKIKLLTREEIVTYGKSKTYIIDPNVQASLAPEDPRKNLTEFDMVARSAADRIFEISVQIRRQKQARQSQIDDSAQQQDEVDGFIYLVDYPQSRSEILAFSKYSQSLHALFEIEEVPVQQEAQEADENEEPTLQVEQQIGNPDSDESRQNSLAIINAFKSARSDCDQRSQLRNLAIIKVQYKNQAQSVGVIEADGSVVDKMRNAEECFVADLFSKNIDKYAQFFVQYLKFKRIVPLEPLVPDRSAQEKIRKLQKEATRDNMQIHDASVDLEITLKEFEQNKGGDQARTEKEASDIKLRYSQLKDQVDQRASQRSQQISDLLRRSKKSLDDENINAVFDMKIYENDFVKDSETANKISSVLSAMVTHIEHVNREFHEPVMARFTNGQNSADAGSRHPHSESNTIDDSSLNDLFDRYATEIACDLNLQSRGQDPVEGPNITDTLSNKYNNQGVQIHDEINKTLEVKQTAPLQVLESDQDRLNQIAQRETQIFENLHVPGKNRYLMPAVPNSSQRLRNAENPQFYPFCTLPVDEAERLLSLRAFQQMIRQNQIDEGKYGIAKHTKYQVFERSFENHMSKEIFAQVLADGLLDEPDVISSYYPRTDSLLLALYNKKQLNRLKVQEGKFRAVGDQDYTTAQNDEAEYVRDWQAKYRVMPDFENWLIIFADELIMEQEIQKPVKKEEPVGGAEPVPVAKGGKDQKATAVDAVDPNAIQVQLMKYIIDEELLPKSLYNVDDQKISNIAQKSAFMYPDDNSVIRVDNYSVGGQNFSKSLVIKDNLRFGLRQRKESEQKPIVNDSDYGLVRQVSNGDTEFFLHFENGTKFGVEQIKMTRNPQKTIRIDPPAPTPEEIAYKLEQQKKLAEAVMKAQKTNKPAPTDIEVPKTPQPTWESAPLNYFDKLFDEEDLKQSMARATLTFQNGLVVQYLGTGLILQTQERLLANKNGEIDRLITKEGVVLRQMANRDAELLFPDGVRATFSRQNLEWIVTNNKGMQRALKDGVFRDLKKIPCAKETDSETGARMMIREDQVITVTYKDGSLFCQHQDGTKMHTNAQKDEIIIEKQGYASHVIKIDSQDSHGGEGPLTRALDRKVIETYLPDGSKSQTFLDIYNTKSRGQVEVYRTLITRSDLSVVLCDSEGHISLISSNTRAALNELGDKMKLGERDIDYLVELQRTGGEFTPQVYQAHISAGSNKSHIKTRNNSNDTVFVLNSDLTFEKLVNGVSIKSHKLNQQQKNQNRRKLAKAMSFAVETGGTVEKLMDMEIEQTGQFQEPNHKYYSQPRLFIVNNDGSARELLSQLQLEYALRIKGLNTDQSLRQKMSDVFNNQIVENHYTITKVINMAQVQISQQSLNSIDLPENAKQILQEKAVAPDFTLLLPKQEQYLYSQIFKMPDCDSFSQQAFANDYQRFIQWKMETVRYDSEFGIIHLPATKDAKVDYERIDDEMSTNKRISIKILKQRAQPKQKFRPDQFKNQAIKEMNSSETVKQFRESGQRSSIGSAGGTIEKQGFGRKNQKSSTSIPRDQTLQVNNGQKAVSKSQSKAQLQKERVDRKLREFQEIKQAGDFIPEYFQSDTGKEFLQKFPQKGPSEEVLIRMKQRIDRFNKSSQKQGELDFDGDHQNQMGQDQAHDNPIVALEPDELKQGSHFTGSKKNDKSTIQPDGTMSQDNGPVILPSLYMQEKMYILQKEQESLLKSEEHHIVKTKDFNVYGRLREEKPFVKTIQKSNVQSELNEKFITTECITDRRVKISSQAPRFYMNAPSVEDVRKQGQHQMILGAIEKKQTFSELINQANSMVTGVLHDSLKRSLNVMPSIVTFGTIRTGTISEVLITLKNEDSIAHRITIKPMTDKRVVVRQNEYGIIAPGMIKQVSVSIRVSEDESDLPITIKDTIQIVSKHDVFKIPVSATVISAQEFDEANQRQLQETGKPIINSRVRERLLSKIADSKDASGPVVLTSLPTHTVSKH